MRVLKSTVILFFALTTLNCMPVGFSLIANGHSTRGPASQDTLEVPCANNNDAVTAPEKILFVVDASGSNSQAYKGLKNGTCAGTPGCVPATDPKKTFRGGSINGFYNRYSKKENFSWGFERFAQNSAESLIRTSNDTAFGNATAMQAAIIAFDKERDGGATPYMAALTYAYGAIVNDLNVQSGSKYPPRYDLVFMSDGYPTDSKVSQINSAVAAIMHLAPTRITLSSVYYSTQYDPFAAAILKKMANTGRGQFVNVNTTTINKISIQDFITLPIISCR